MSTEVNYKELEPRIFSLRFWVSTVEPGEIKQAFNRIMKLTNYNILDFTEYTFPVQGYTAIWLLAESHLAVHTFPGNKWSYVELSGCNEQKTIEFKQLLVNSDFKISWEDQQPHQSFPGKIVSSV